MHRRESAEIQMHRREETVRRCLVHVCQYLVCRGVVGAVESEHVCGRCCGVSTVRASGDVFAESVLVSGLTRNTWRVTKRVE